MPTPVVSFNMVTLFSSATVKEWPSAMSMSVFSAAVHMIVSGEDVRA